MKRKALVAGGIAAAVVVAAGGGIAYSNATAGVFVGTAVAQVASISQTANASGTVAAGSHQGVYPVAAGTIGKISVSDGDTVSKGQTLATMATGPLKLAVTNAKAAVKTAQASVTGVNKSVPTSVDTSAARAAVNAASSAVSTASKNYTAYNKQYKKANSATRKTMAPTLRTLQSARAQAQATLSQARATLLGLQNSANVSSARSAANESVTAAQANLTQAQKNLDNAALKAPFDGIVTFAPAIEKGAGLTPGVAAFTVTDPTKMDFEAAVDETDIGNVTTGQQATVTLDSAPSTPFTGTVDHVATTATMTATGSVSYPVRITFSYGQTPVFAGMSGSATIAVETVVDAVTVPVEAVVTGSDSTSVFVVGADNVAHQVRVQVGAQSDTMVQITSGVKEGDVVVTAGATTLTDGQTVKKA